MKLEVYTHDRKLLFDIFGQTSTIKIRSIDIPGGAKLNYHGTTECLSDNFPSIINLTVDLATNIGASLIAAWLYTKFKGRVEKIVSKKKVIELNKSRIQYFIEEEIRIKK